MTDSQTDTEQVENLLQQPRGQELEFLRADTTTLRLAQAMASLANAEGGIILLGVDPRTKATDAGHGPRLRDLALEAAQLTDPPLILPLPQAVPRPDGVLVLIRVPPGLPHVYGVRGRFLVRQGGRNATLDSRALRRLVRERVAGDFDSQPTPEAGLDDLDWQRVEGYIEKAEGLAGSSPEEALLLRGCLSHADGAYLPTVAGLLLFSKHPERFFPSSEIIVVRYPGKEMGDDFIREDIHGPLPDQIRRAEAFLVNQMRRGVYLRDLHRQEQPEYPPEALREAVVNAVAHRDYAIRGEGIRILMFADRVECYSPGRLPGHVTIQNLVQERFSRNQAIVQVLADMGFIERLGYGIDRMIGQMESLGLPAPDFRETANGFQVTLYGPGHDLLTLSAPEGPWSGLQLNPRQEAGLKFIAEYERITNRQYRELHPDISDETARRDLADLVDKGLLLKIGEKRATYYVLK